MGIPKMGSTLNEIVEHYFPSLPPGPKMHAAEYILRVFVAHRWQPPRSLDDIPGSAWHLGAGPLMLELCATTETHAVRMLYDCYFAALAQDNPDWGEFERLADTLPRYGKNKGRGSDWFVWPAKLPVLPLLLFGKNSKPLPRADEC